MLYEDRSKVNKRVLRASKCKEEARSNMSRKRKKTMDDIQIQQHSITNKTNPIHL